MRRRGHRKLLIFMQNAKELRQKYSAIAEPYKVADYQYKLDQLVALMEHLHGNFERRSIHFEGIDLLEYEQLVRYLVYSSMAEFCCYMRSLGRVLLRYLFCIYLLLCILVSNQLDEYPEPQFFMKFVSRYLYSESDHLMPFQAILKTGSIPLSLEDTAHRFARRNGVTVELGEEVYNDQGAAMIRYRAPACHPSSLFECIYHGYLMVSRYTILEGPMDSKVHLSALVPQYVYGESHIVSFILVRNRR